MEWPGELRARRAVATRKVKSGLALQNLGGRRAFAVRGFIYLQELAVTSGGASSVFLVGLF